MVTGKVVFRVLNVVVSGSLGVELNLDTIAMAFPKNTRYWRGALPRIVFRLENSRIAILLFRNGKLVCVGAKSARASLLLNSD